MVEDYLAKEVLGKVVQTEMEAKAEVEMEMEVFPCTSLRFL